jgi:hypothetical protein
MIVDFLFGGRDLILHFYSTFIFAKFKIKKSTCTPESAPDKGIFLKKYIFSRFFKISTGSKTFSKVAFNRRLFEGYF